MLVPPQGRNATARHAVDAMLRLGRPELVRASIERCLLEAQTHRKLDRIDEYAAQLAELRLREE